MALPLRKGTTCVDVCEREGVAMVMVMVMMVVVGGEGG